MRALIPTTELLLLGVVFASLMQGAPAVLPSACLISVLLGLIVWGVVDLSSGVFAPVLLHCRSVGGGEIALTFDDGPDPKGTVALAEVLEARGLRATFFVVGERVARHPEILARLVQKGHEIGGHGHIHSPLRSLLPFAPLGRQMDSLAQILRASGAPALRWFRPPVGLLNPPLAGQVERRGWRLVGWSLRSRDTQTADEATVERVLSAIVPGDIVLLHDGAQGAGTRRRGINPEGLERLLDGLEARNLHCVVLSELVGWPNPQRLRYNWARSE